MYFNDVENYRVINRCSHSLGDISLAGKQIGLSDNFCGAIEIGFSKPQLSLVFMAWLMRRFVLPQNLSDNHNSSYNDTFSIPDSSDKCKGCSVTYGAKAEQKGVSLLLARQKAPYFAHRQKTKA